MTVSDLLRQFLEIVGTHSRGEELWNEWLSTEQEEEKKLKTLLYADVHKEFKARALIILLAPDLHNLPFRWRSRDGIQPYLSMRLIEPAVLPEDLLRFAGELVCLNVDFALGSQNERIRGSLLEYNRLILKFLAILPESDDLALLLFRRFQINDPVSYANMDDASGYIPFRNILSDFNVPERWKVLADREMRKRILAELEGTKPREEWETALRCYTDHIQTAFSIGGTTYTRDLLCSQIRFITELPGIEDYPHALFRSWQVNLVMQELAGKKLRDLRHKFARLVVLCKDTQGFSVWNQESHRVATRIFDEFGAEDEDLGRRLWILIEGARRREAELNEAVRGKQMRVEDVLSLMK